MLAAAASAIGRLRQPAVSAAAADDEVSVGLATEAKVMVGFGLRYRVVRSPCGAGAANVRVARRQSGRSLW